MINYTRGFSNSPKQWMNFQALLGFSCHKLNWYLDTNIKPVKLIILQFLTTQLFPVTCHSLQLFLMLILVKKTPDFLTRIFTGIAPMAPLGPGVSSSRPNSGHRPGFSPYESHNIQTINTNGEFILDPYDQLGPCCQIQYWQTLSQHRHIVKLYNF